MEKTRELDFIRIDGEYYGGDQEWNENWLMNAGGCSTSTACECSICMARDCKDARELYPFDPFNVTRSDFLCFFREMFRFVRPGIGGLTNLEKYARLFTEYGQSRHVLLAHQLLHGTESVAAAADFIMRGIDSGTPLAYLMLRHRDPFFEDFVWHWFTVTGYSGSGENLQIIAATYAERYEFSLSRAWETGHTWRGGIVRMRPTGAL